MKMSLLIYCREARLLLKIDQKLEEAIGTNLESILQQVKSNKEALSEIKAKMEKDGGAGTEDDSDDDMGFGLFD